MNSEANFLWIKKLTALFSFSLTVLLVSFSSLKIVGEGNSLVDIFLSCLVFIGFLGLFKIIRKLLIWYF